MFDILKTLKKTTQGAHDELHEAMDKHLLDLHEICAKHKIPRELVTPLVTHILDDAAEHLVKADRQEREDRIEQNTVKLPTYTCKCGKDLDAAIRSDGTKAQPRQGDLTLCGHCGRVFIFTSPTEVREAEQEDLNRYSEDELKLLYSAQKAVKEFNKQK